MLAAMVATMLLGAGGGFVPIEPEPEPHEDNDEPEDEPERPIARVAPPPVASGFGARAERRRQARAARRGAR